MLKHTIALLALVVSTGALADPCMIKVSSTSYVNAEHVAVVQVWNKDRVLFTSNTGRDLVILRLSNTEEASAYVDQVVVRINQCGNKK